MSLRVAELTVDELKQIIQDAVEQKLSEMFGDPDERLELREEIKARLRRSLEIEDIRLPAVEVVGDEQGEEIVLGRNVLNRLRLLLDGPAGQLEILDS